MTGISEIAIIRKVKWLQSIRQLLEKEKLNNDANTDTSIEIRAQSYIALMQPGCLYGIQC